MTRVLPSLRTSTTKFGAIDGYYRLLGLSEIDPCSQTTRLGHAPKNAIESDDGAAGPGRDTARFGLGFAAPQWAVTPGQSAVVYDGEVCLGGGVIAATA